VVILFLKYLLFPLSISLSFPYSFERVNYASFVFGTGLILFALEYKKTPTSAIAVPATKLGPQKRK
jgi:hypothetical protein